MLDFFAQYLLFFLKTITLVASVLLVLITLFALIAKQRRAQAHSLMPPPSRRPGTAH